MLGGTGEINGARTLLSFLVIDTPATGAASGYADSTTIFIPLEIGLPTDLSTPISLEILGGGIESVSSTAVLLVCDACED